MEQIIDFILVAASGAAIFYCVTLSRRLEKLKCAEMDLGSAIASLSGIVDKANRAVADAAANSDRSARELAPLLEQTRKAIPELGELIDIVSELTEITKAELDEAGDEFDRRLSNKMRSADRIITELSTLTASAARSAQPIGPQYRHAALRAAGRKSTNASQAAQ